MVQAAASLLVGLALLAGTALPAAVAPAQSRHSGAVALIDPQSGVMVVDEVGPWRLAQGRTVVTRRTITLRPDTRISKFIRVNAPGAFAGDFIEVDFEATDLSVGDFVTAVCVREAGGLVARAVAVAELQ